MDKIEGTVFHVFPADTNTDEVISGKYKYDEVDMEKLAVHTFETLVPNFYADAKAFASPIIVAEKNFGCGSSREQAPHVLRACGIRCVIAPSFARIFYRNSFNIGLPLVGCRDITAHAKPGDELEVDFASCRIRNRTRDDEIPFQKIPDFMLGLLEEGGLMPYLRKHGGWK
jgi:3-isopropylmalate/(R)-2-methylmalate dehydratase small subunit